MEGRLMSSEERAELLRSQGVSNVVIKSFGDRLREIDSAITDKLKTHDIFDLPMDIMPHFEKSIQKIVDKRGLRCSMEEFTELPSGKKFLCVTVGLKTADFAAFEAER